MNQAAGIFAAALDEMGISYRMEDEKAVRIGFTMENGSMSMVFVFGDGCGDVHIMGMDFANVPENNEYILYWICNELNKRFRWTKFYLDNDGDLICEDDAVIQLDSCAEECKELMERMASIVDEAIPMIYNGLYQE